MLFNITYDIKEFDEEKDGKKTGKKIPYKQLYLDFNGALVPIKVLYKSNSSIKNLVVGMIDAENRNYQNNVVDNYGPEPKECNDYVDPNAGPRY